MCTLSQISLDIAPVNHLHPVELAAERCTCHPGRLRHVRLQWLPDARLQRIDDAVDGSIGLSEDAPQSKVTGIHVRGAGGPDVLQHEHRPDIQQTTQ